MVTEARLVRLAVRPGKEADVAALLEDGLAVVQREPAAIAWFAIPIGRGSVEVFDAFPDDAARRTHLSGRVAGELMARAEEPFAPTPAFDPFVETVSERPGGG